ncbi:MAG: L-threonylcarbamoyladenylate synthase [Desulfovibrio sp.]
MRSILQTLRDGGVVVYPTETLYALGCHGLSRDAAMRVSRIKRRPEAKPLPLIIGAPEMLELVTAEIPDCVLALAAVFWPGPLSILVRARAEVPRPVRDARGLVSVRCTPHPLAAELSRALHAPLVATSANFSGDPAVGRPEELNPDLLACADAAMLTEPYPLGGAASTVVFPLDDGRLEILRRGAVSEERLREHGFSIQSD